MRVLLAVLVSGIMQTACGGTSLLDTDDAGSHPDAGAPHDAGSPGNDAGSPGNDAGSPGNDAGSPGNDAGSPGNDAGSPGNDAGSPGNDAGSPGNDAGSPGNDAGSPGNDAGSPGNDAGSPGNDAGSPGNDAGSPGNDAGSPGMDGGLPGMDGGVASMETAPVWVQILSTPYGVYLSWLPGAQSPSSALLLYDYGSQMPQIVMGNTYQDYYPIYSGTRMYGLETADGLYSAPTLTVGSPPAAPTLQWLNATEIQVTPAGGCVDGALFQRTIDYGSPTTVTLPGCIDSNVTVGSGHTYSYAAEEVDGVVVLQSSTVSISDPTMVTAYAYAQSESDQTSVSFYGTASSYQIWLSTPENPTATNVYSGTSSPQNVTCAEGDTCTIFVRGLYGDGSTAGQSQTFSVQAAPAAPTNFMLVDGTFTATLSWSSPANGTADSYQIFANGQYLISITGLSAVVDPLPFTVTSYVVKSVRNGLLGGSTQPLSVDVTTEASLVNPSVGSGCLAYQNPSGLLDQTVTMPFGGTLIYVAAQISATSYYYGTSLDVMTGPATDNLSTIDAPGSGPVGATVLGGSYATYNLPVSAGEQLTLHFPDPTTSVCVSTGGAFDGGTFSVDGVPLDGFSLIFSIWIDPATSLAAPVLTATAETSAAYLSWTASTSAVSYDVQRIAQGGSLGSIGSTSDTWFLDTSATPGSSYGYSVVAHDSGSGMATSNFAAVQLDKTRISTDSLQGHSVITLPAGASIGQSFVVADGGMLNRIEVPLGVAAYGYDSLSISLLQSDGGALGSSVSNYGYVNTYTTAPPPASAWFSEQASFDFSDGGIALTPGEQLSFQITNGQQYYYGSNIYVRASATDVYDGGTLYFDGGAVPGQDLTFKVIVQ